MKGGRGADQFDAPNFPVAFAYTIDSGRVGHFEYETFNAAQAVITIEEPVSIRERPMVR